MTMVPLVVNFEGDFVLQLVPVESSFTMDQVAEAAAHHSLNRRVKPREGGVLRVRIQDAEEPVDRSDTVEQAGFENMETIEVYYE
ncbi:toluene-4-monooxygenase system B family protein [Emcibacter nanhaiensis]|uniref:Toluene monooxygenase n=1 Tax=Emcibacter nanhaiensis TaxID=1505037 RepID=A0A501PJI3_9PROT|nr:toluene-4-monooxygenase system B family protein [Emcibacter nanhaiensis]TPD60629.1 toluene monooxygenase [Emcibacter nanhaiensis]